MNAAAALQHRRPLWLATLVTWLAMPVGYALFAAFVELGAPDTARRANILPIVSLILWIGLPLTAIAMFLLGLPLVLLFRAHGWLAAVPVCLAATLVGAVAMPLFFALLDRAAPSLDLLWIGAAFGAGSGVVFSLVAGVRWLPRHP